MPVPVPIFAFAPKVSDFRFVLVNDPTPDNYLVGGVYQFDQKLFNESAMEWQLQKKYYIKRTFQDPCTVYLNTQVNFVGDTGPYPDLQVIDDCGNLVRLLSVPPYTKGAQQVTGNDIVVYDPETGLPTTYPMNSFLWKFTFGDFLTPATQSGIYHLKVRVISADSDVYQDYISEPIMVYNSFPNTVLIQGKNLTNRAKQNVLASGWDDDMPPTFNHRVEGYPEQYTPEGQYVNFLSGDFFNKQLTAENWRTWRFNLGGMMDGVPAYMVEKISELFITDQWKINNKFFTISATTSEGVKQLWEIKDPKASGLVNGFIPIRERYMNENVTVVLTPTPGIPLWISPWENPDVPNPSPGDFMPYGLTPFRIYKPTGPVDIGPFVFETESDENTFLSTFNATYPTLTGTIARTDGVFEYFAGAGEDVSVFPSALWKAFTFKVKLGVGATMWRFQFGRYGLTQSVWNWDMAGELGNIVYIGGGGIFTATNTYPAVLMDTYKFPTIYHNDAIAALAANDSGLGATARLDAISGVLPSQLIALTVAGCSRFAESTGYVVGGIDLSNTPNLQNLSIRNNNVIAISDTIFNSLLPVLKQIALDSNPIASPTNIDDLFNAFVTNSWDGIEDGLFDFNCVPALAPTAASATARGDLITAGWNVQVDP